MNLKTSSLKKWNGMKIHGSQKNCSKSLPVHFNLDSLRSKMIVTSLKNIKSKIDEYGCEIAFHEHSRFYL